jgi:signal peptidase II
MKTLSPRLIGLLCIAGALVADQLSKWFVLTDLMNPPQVISVLPVFDLVLAWNKGVSFGFLNHYGPNGTIALIAVSCAITVFFLIWLLRARNLWLGVGLGFVVGGATGNLIDRIQFGAVVDFLHFHHGNFSFPAFNLADTFITIGVILIFVESFISHHGEKSV